MSAMESRERAAKMERLAPPLNDREKLAINGLFRAFLFKRNSTGEVWTTCCRAHRVIGPQVESDAERRILHAVHTPEPRNGWDNTPGWKRREKCPFCGAEVTVKELRYSGRRKNLWQYRRAVVLRQWRGALWATAWDCFKDYGGKDALTEEPLLTMLPRVKLLGVYRFTPGRVEQATRPWWATGAPLTYRVQTEPGRSGHMWAIHGPFEYCADLGGKGYDVIGWEEIQKSALRYCGLDKVRVAADRQIELLTAGCFFPQQIEWLVKLGLQEAVTELVNRGVKNADVIQWSAGTPERFIGCTVKELRALTEQTGDAVDALRIYKALRGTKAESTPAECGELEEMADRNTIKVLLPRMKRYGLSIGKLKAWMEKHRREERCERGDRNLLRMYADYLTAAEGCGIDLENSIHLLPKDFVDKHDSVTAAWSAICECRRNEKTHNEYRKRLVNLRDKYLFWDEQYLIRPPVSAGEIVKEGEVLKHCVGGYADRHLAGSTTILFLRRKDRPHTPLATIEINGSTIRQVHGYRNELESCPDNPGKVPARDLYRAFLDQWINWLKGGRKRYKDGRPKLPRRRKKEDAA